MLLLMSATDTNARTRTEVLVAIDWDRKGADLAPVIAAIEAEGALLGVATDEEWTNWKGVTMTRHEVRFNALKIRNTEVHGLGYRAGFVVNVEPGD
jgi:hypothetical protein